MKTTLFFDLFDTLVKVNRGYLEAFFDRETDRLGDLGILKDAKSTIGKLISLHPELAQKGSIDEISKYYENCMRKSLVEIPENILQMLDSLKSAGYRLCIISDATYTDILYWDESPLAQYFNETVFSCEIGIVKPDLKLYSYALEKMGCRDNYFFIGDGGHDELKGAIFSGMTTIKAEWLTNRELGIGDKYVEHYAKTTEELLKLV